MWQPLAKDLAIETGTPVFGKLLEMIESLITKPSTIGNV